jgi:hypothetical protein
MHTPRAFSARTFLLWFGALAALALTSGCTSIALSNLTPASLPENPSEIYTFTLRVTPKNQVMIRSSITPHVIVDGQNFAMKRSSLGDDLYEFEYQLPPGRTEIAYYYLVNYEVEGSQGPVAGESYTAIEHAKIARRYVLSLEVNRGPVGSSISVVGRGFTPQDVIPAGKNYEVALKGQAGNSAVGTFRIDGANISVSPSSLTLASGERQSLTFTLATIAPPGGLLLDVATDVPESVIMPEVMVPAGETSVTVTVEGGRPGSGNLVLKGYGGSDVSIPVTVTGGAPVSAK